MNIVSAILGSVGLAAILFALAILALFGRKLGAVTKMRSFYQGYYAAIACVGLALVIRLVRVSVAWSSPQSIPEALGSPIFYLFLYHLPLAIGLTLALGITWYYWGWLLKER
jgi:hypothetical protein